jgi:Domain of unknown function (DUF5658)
MVRCRLVWVAAAIAASMAGMVVSTNAAGQDWQGDQSRAVRRSSEHAVGRWTPARGNRAITVDHPMRFDRDEDGLNVRIQHVSQELAALEHETEPAAANDAAIYSVDDLTPFSFRLMGYLSIALALCGLVVVVRNRPTFGGLRGKNESHDARRTVVRCIVVLIVLNLADLGFTSLLVPTRSFVELNPLADSLLDSLPRLIVVKSALIGGGTLLLLALWRHKIAQLASWGTAVTYVFAALWWVMYFHAATS